MWPISVSFSLDPNDVVFPSAFRTRFTPGTKVDKPTLAPSSVHHVRINCRTPDFRVSPGGRKHRKTRSISEISSCFFGPKPWHIEIRHRVKQTSTINLFGFETLKLKIRRLKLWKPTAQEGNKQPWRQELGGGGDRLWAADAWFACVRWGWASCRGAVFRQPKGYELISVTTCVHSCLNNTTLHVSL